VRLLGTPENSKRTTMRRFGSAIASARLRSVHIRTVGSKSAGSMRVREPPAAECVNDRA